MEIEIDDKNRQVLLDVLFKTTGIIRKISDSGSNPKDDKKKLVLYDLLFRLYPNLNTISLLFEQYFTHKNYGNTVPMGLIMRCCLEDMIYAKYLLTFKDDPKVFENEIIVQSKNAVKEYLEYIIENEPDFWKCPDEKKAEIKTSRLEDYEVFKKANPQFFNENGKIKNFAQIRQAVPETSKYFDNITKTRQGPCNMYKRIKTVDFDFSYIYFIYKFYCLFEHYSFHTRDTMKLNNFTFGHIALGVEFILRAIINILEYLNIDKNIIIEVREINKTLGTLLNK